MKFVIGLDIINSYKRLSYQPWYALAEFIDNSTQAYFNNKEILDEQFKKESEILEVKIIYDKETETIRIVDNSIGMNLEELEYALHLGKPPKNSDGRSRYGLGLKTASCWLGNYWTILTKKLGDKKVYFTAIDVEKVSNGDDNLDLKSYDKEPEMHFTVIEIKKLNKKFRGNSLAKIRNYLRSMYRADIQKKRLKLSFMGEELKWETEPLLKDHSGNEYKKNYSFEVDGKKVTGWVGILAKGSRANAGFTILNNERVIKGWPDSWRPSTLYGQTQGSNDLVNQRLVGEINLDAFEVSHTKDDIQWFGDQEDQVEELLGIHCLDYKTRAQQLRYREDNENKPSDLEINVAVDELKEELSSSEIVDQVNIDIIPPKDDVDKSISEQIRKIIQVEKPTISKEISNIKVEIYVVSLSVNDPYYLSEYSKEDLIQVLINTSHPFFSFIKGSDGVLNYFRECTYDAMAEWQAMKKVGRIDSNTIHLLKDGLLRVPFRISEDLIK